MGWFGVNKSKQTAVNTSTDNSNVAASDSSIALGQGAVFYSESLDGGAIEEAFGLGNNALDTVGASVKSAFGFGGEALSLVGDAFARAATITTSAQEKQAQSARDSLQAVVALSTAQQKAGVQSLTENVMKWGVVALGVMAAAFAVSAMSQKKRAV